MKLKEGFILRQVAGENVVLPSGEATDLNMMITLNDTGRFLWEKLENGADEEMLIAAILAEYDTDRETAAKSIVAFIQELRRNGLLEEQ